MEKLLNVKEASSLLGVKQSTLYSWAERRDKNGRSFVPHIKLGRLLKFSEEDLAKWVKDRQVSGRGGKF